MKKKRRKMNIGLLVFIITTFSLIVVALCVHLFLSKYIHTEARRSINSCVDYLNSPSDDSYMDYLEGDYLFKSSYIDLDYAMLFSNDTTSHYSVDSLVTEWCANNKDKRNEIYMVKLQDRICYIKQTKINNSTSHFVVYTDVSSAKRMSAIVEVIIIIVMIICDIVATFMGHRMNKAIQEEEDKQKRFFENASHELKTPLMSIQGFSEGLEKGIIKDQQNAYKVIQKEVGKMSRMVDDILLLSKHDRESVQYNFEEISIKELIGDVLDTFYMEIKNRNINLLVDIDDKFINVDIDQMHRAISNIISNGLRYAHTTLQIVFKQNVLYIWNDGVQLSAEDQSKMFDRFYMGQGGSTGIGLSLAKEIIEKHGFNIKAENYSNGVRFVIELSV